jgi:2-keto-3-deoxy-L-rhamnonate aldolase RhmA
MNKQELLSGLTIGSWIQIGSPVVGEIMASAGFDWLAIDLEHSMITLREAEDLIRVIDLKGVIPLVRLSSNNHEQIKRVMDAGAHGVIVPMVNSAAEALAVVQSVKYPPLGSRSIGLARAQGYGVGFDKYFEWQKEQTIIVVQIEHVDAVANIEEILEVQGIDAYIVGPYDLSGSMGLPGLFESPQFLSALQKIHSAGKKLGVPGGLHIVEPDPEALQECIKQGNQFIAYGIDTRMIDMACRNGLKNKKDDIL